MKPNYNLPGTVVQDRFPETCRSDVAVEAKILLTSDDGDTFVIKAGPEREMLGTNSIGEPCNTSIAIAGGKLFVRGAKHLFRHRQ